jgi:hypothetical protein
LQTSTQHLSGAHGLVKGDIEAIEGELARYQAKCQAVKDKRAEVDRLLAESLPALDTATFVAAATAECESHSALASWWCLVLAMQPARPLGARALGHCRVKLLQ